MTIAESSNQEIRRQFLVREGGGFLGLVGALAAALTYWPSKPSKGLANDVREAFIGDRLRTTDPLKIIDMFYQAQPGSLGVFYQLFFPHFVRHETALDRTLKLKALCKRELEADEKKPAQEQQYADRPHRLRALPAVAASHALGLFRGEASEEFRELIAKTHCRAISPDERPNREVLEIIWQNMTAALVRNKNNWEVFSAGPALIEEAEKVCSKFLADEPVLLLAAAEAWQFLLTYSRAVECRGDDGELERVRASLDCISSHEGPQLAWFQKFQCFYHTRRTHYDMLPQLTEPAIGRIRATHNQIRATHNQEEVGLVDFLVLMQLQSIHTDHLVMQEGIISPYSTAARAKQIVEKTHTKLLAYDVWPSDWPRYRALAAQGTLPLTEETLNFLDDMFEAYERVIEPSELDTMNANSIGLFHSVPFYKLDEEQSFIYAHPEMQSFADFNPDMFTRSAVIDIWHKTGTAVAERQARAADIQLPEKFEETLECEIHSLVDSCDAQLEYLRDVSEGLKANGKCLGALAATDGDLRRKPAETHGPTDEIVSNVSEAVAAPDGGRPPVAPQKRSKPVKRPGRIDPRVASRAIDKYFSETSDEDFYSDLEKWSPELIKFWSLPDPRSTKKGQRSN